MKSSVCNHQTANECLLSGDPLRALRIVGPMLENNPSDLTAWKLGALALIAHGDSALGVKNLKSVALAMAEERNPIQAIATAKEIQDLGQDSGDLIPAIARIYGSESDRIEEAEIPPPPLPAKLEAEPWGDDLEDEQVVSRAGDAMAMAWGAALTLPERGIRLPYIPLLSALCASDFEHLTNALVRQVVEEQEVIVEQGATGDAMYIVAQGSVAVMHQSAGSDPIELARLGPGAFFGEMALVSSTTRAATVRASERTVLLRADKTEMEHLTERFAKTGDVLVAFCHARMLENLMRVSPVLRPVPPRRRPDVISRFNTDYRSEGEVIIEQGSDCPGLFLIVSGGVRVNKIEDNEDVVLAHLGPGDLFGEISLLMRKPSTAKVTADQNSALLFLPRTEFESATAEFPEFLKGVYDIAMDREMRNNSIMGLPAQDADGLILV
jgi:CRP-like cAMP-binding protein